MGFENMKKKQFLKTDKSNIGKWDPKIKSLCEKINKKKEYYTTSSCAGRIVLLKSSDKKIENAFLFRTHNKITFKELKKALEKIQYKDLVEFQQSSCILHVACTLLKDAQELVNKAKFAGWKRSGIMSTGRRNMVELHSTETMSFPIMNNSEVLVNEGFLKVVVEQANGKLGRVWEKIERLRDLI